MKRMYKVLVAAMCVTFLGGCTTNQFEDDMASASAVSDSRGLGGGQDRCATMKVLEEKIKENPGLLRRMEAIEAHTNRFIENQKAGGNTRPGNGGGGGGGTTPAPSPAPTTTIIIPVHVNLIYNTTLQDISIDQIQSQIDVLNADFQKTNGDVNTTNPFSGVASNMDVKFVWDPKQGDFTRKQSSKTSWGTRDDMKYSRKGGIDATSPATKLNIWVCNIGGGILGYAQFPGGMLATDGIVVSPQYFGTRGYVAAPFNLGRTATHEVGHWLNLRHIWGDGGCSVDDYVADTPGSDSPNYGCPGTVVKCGSQDMTMNFMDYTDDKCMYMFTLGQKTRSRAIFASDGARSSFVAKLTN